MIVNYSELNANQKQQFIVLFGENFFDLVDKKAKHTAKLQIVFGDAFISEFAYAYLDSDKVTGLISCSNMQRSSLRFSESVCKAQFGSVLGAINYRVFKSFFGKPVAKAADEGYIDFLCVDKDSRRQGIASQLMSFVYDNTQFAFYLLKVMAKNTGAIKLYEHRGYKVEKEKKGRMLRLIQQHFVYLMRYTKPL